MFHDFIQIHKSTLTTHVVMYKSLESFDPTQHHEHITILYSRVYICFSKELRDSRLWLRPAPRARFTQFLAHKYT